MLVRRWESALVEFSLAQPAMVASLGLSHTMFAMRLADSLRRDSRRGGLQLKTSHSEEGLRSSELRLTSFIMPVNSRWCQKPIRGGRWLN